MKHIIYIHGFASVGESPKITKMRDQFTNATVHAPTLSFGPCDSVNYLSTLIEDLASKPDTEQIILIGTSLGGLYGAYLSTSYDIPVFLINPLLDPEYSNIKTGEYRNYATGKNITVTKEHIVELDMIAKKAETVDMTNVYAFLACDDDIINPNIALERLAHARGLFTYRDGGHRFVNIERIFDVLGVVLEKGVAQ